jgi:hypothetical protein
MIMPWVAEEFVAVRVVPPPVKVTPEVEMVKVLVVEPPRRGEGAGASTVRLTNVPGKAVIVHDVLDAVEREMMLVPLIVGTVW